MKFSRLTTNGRVTVPALLRKRYGLTPGKKVKFQATEDGIRIIPLVTKEEIETHIGFLRTKGKLLRALIKVKKIEREL